ncbi:MAG TPA: cobalt-precorrin-7 (C(5))-methyltransferase [Methanoregulaceae archaeon]|nr:cobalt-precorrin-7 (C(5))-methyltransferase [Methanoregulaceae archaeon]
MMIVGVGCGPGMITVKAIEAILGANLIYGSRRAIELASGHINDSCTVHEISDYGSLRSIPDAAVVLSTGDPMLAGLGYLEGEIIPGISSLQIAAARLHIPIYRFTVVVAHGKDHGKACREAAQEIARGKVVFLIADPKFDLRALGTILQDTGELTRIALCEKLGYPEERIVIGTPREPPVAESDLFSVVAGTF